MYVQVEQHVYLWTVDAVSYYHFKSPTWCMLWSWSYGSWIYNYMCNQCLSPLIQRSNPIHGKVYSIQHYVIKFVSDLRQVGGFLWVLWFPPPIKLTATI